MTPDNLGLGKLRCTACGGALLRKTDDNHQAERAPTEPHEEFLARQERERKFLECFRCKRRYPNDLHY